MRIVGAPMSTARSIHAFTCVISFSSSGPGGWVNVFPMAVPLTVRPSNKARFRSCRSCAGLTGVGMKYDVGSVPSSSSRAHRSTKSSIVMLPGAGVRPARR